MGKHGAIKLIGEKKMAILIPEQFTGIKNEDKSAGLRIPHGREFHDWNRQRPSV